MNIIFLDVDGVLNSLPYCEQQRGRTGHHEISDFHLNKLSEIYHSCDACIVLASTWRYLKDAKGNEAGMMYKYLEDSLAQYGMNIVGHTPVVGGNRPLEIATWLKEQEYNDRFVVLDDDFPKEEYEKWGIGDHLVQTKFFCCKESEGGSSRNM